MNPASLITKFSLGLMATAAFALATPAADAAELKLLSQGLPAGSYTGGDAKAGKDSGPELAFDGITHGPGSAFCNGPNYPAWLMVDLGADCKIIKTKTFFERSNVFYSYLIEVSADRQTWTTFVDQTRNKDPSEDPSYTDMGLTVGRYVRITMTDVAEREKNWFWPVIVEFQVYGLKLPPPPASATVAATATGAATTSTGAVKK